MVSPQEREYELTARQDQGVMLHVPGLSMQIDTFPIWGNALMLKMFHPARVLSEGRRHSRRQVATCKPVGVKSTIVHDFRG